MQKLADNIFLQRHPLSLMGCRMGRNVTLIRLSSGQVIIHSTANFSDAERSEIDALGEPGWLVEATNFHDTNTLTGQECFPNARLLVPSGFPLRDRVDSRNITEGEEEWHDEVEIVVMEGMPKIQEHAFFHRPSKTLIVADLLFHLPPSAGWWTHTFLRHASGIKTYPGMSRLFRFFIKDRDAFLASIRKLYSLPFERIVFAHGDPICADARQVFRSAMEREGFSP